MFNVKKQIARLYVSSVLEELSLTGAWVAILAARGYSLVEIGLAETVFHIMSLLFEIPSGVFADVFGRKNMLIVSSLLRMTGNVMMILSGNRSEYGFLMVCVSIAFQAVSYSFLSGSGEALAYDSLKEAECEEYYEKYASNQLVIYRLCGGISTMCAGLALFIGYRLAYGTDVFMCLMMAVGGFLAALGDDALQVRTNTILQDSFPSEQRATLLSIESFTFSVIMIVMSPFAGMLFSRW